MQVGLLPTKINDYTRSMFPMKYFEYLAAGLPVVGTAQEFARTHHDGLETARTVAEIILALEKQLRHGRYQGQQAREMLHDNTWHARTGNMLVSIPSLRAASCA
jgi:hypothetical protein